VAFRLEEIGNDEQTQRRALKRLAELIMKGMRDPAVVRAARAITKGCDARDDRCELEAIYDAVKNGTDTVPGMEDGFRYVADPQTTDYFIGASRILEECKQGACAGDCDESTVLVASLAGAVGFKVGARAWGPKPNVNEFVHVMPVAALPKKGPHPASYAGHNMDVTVPEAYVGWSPAKGRVLTYWIVEG
jgi:hypothetical protein